MATRKQPTYPPNTPDWFKPFWEQNGKQHDELRKDFQAEVRKLRSDLPKQIIEGIKSTYTTGGGNPYSHDRKE